MNQLEGANAANGNTDSHRPVKTRPKPASPTQHAVPHQPNTMFRPQTNGTFTPWLPAYPTLTPAPAVCPLPFPTLHSPTTYPLKQ